MRSETKLSRCCFVMVCCFFKGTQTYFATFITEACSCRSRRFWNMQFVSEPCVKNVLLDPGNKGFRAITRLLRLFPPQPHLPLTSSLFHSRTCLTCPPGGSVAPPPPLRCSPQTGREPERRTHDDASLCNIGLLFLMTLPGPGPGPEPDLYRGRPHTVLQI